MVTSESAIDVQAGHCRDQINLIEDAAKEQGRAQPVGHEKARRDSFKSEIAAYADCNRQAVERALASASMEGTRTRIDLGDLWDAPDGERPTWAGVVAGEGLMRPVRDPDIVAAAAPLLGPDGAWRAAAEKVAPRLIRRSYQGYGEEDAGRWSGAVDALVERLRPSCASDGAEIGRAHV